MKLTLRNGRGQGRIHPPVLLRIVGLLSTLIRITACSQAAPSPSRYLPDVVLAGQPGLQRIHDRAQLPAPLRDLVDAVGMTSNGCTATHVGGRRVLTAGHCLDAQSCQNTSVYWGYLAGTTPSMTSRCTRVITSERELGL